MRFKPLLLFFLIISNNIFSLSSSTQYSRIIQWQEPRQVKALDGRSLKLLCFQNVQYDDNYSPIFFERVAVNSQSVSVSLTNQQFVPLDNPELINSDILSTSLNFTSSIAYDRKKPYAIISFIPVRKNPSSGLLEKLISFDINIEPTYTSKKLSAVQHSYATNSVLASGSWFKLGITEDAVYKLSYDFFTKLDFDLNNLDIDNIQIYGNGGAMLPMANQDPKADDLIENAIMVKDFNANGLLDSADYVLFYGQAPHKWYHDENDNRFHHQTHLYSDTTYYFLVTGLGLGKRITTQSSSAAIPTHTVNSFDNFYFHEKDEVNLLKSGREWFGEVFDILTSYNFILSFPNLDISTPIYIKSSVAARSTSASNNKFILNINGSGILTHDISAISGIYYQDYAKESSLFTTFLSSSTQLSLTYTYAKPLSTSIGWLNFFELNFRQNLSMSENQLIFRDLNSVAAGNIALFNISNAASAEVWEITDPYNIKIQDISINAALASFTLPTDSLREFIIFKNASFLTPASYQPVANQNLHATSQADLIIVSYPDFLSEANRLAEFHISNDTLEAIVVTPQQIYNEFSSGARDITAIRNFVKMLYDRAEANTNLLPRYLLLFGDGSYDNKNRIAINTNLIPTYQSANSLSPTSSYTSDDFYGLLDDNEGSWETTEILDIGIGRLPVASMEAAKIQVDKIINYAKPEPSVDANCTDGQATSFGDWRNIICFISDDEDGGQYTSQSETLANKLDTIYDSYNIDKIYLDSYTQESTPGGERYPDARDAINKRVDRGALLINYTGHGGEVGWAHERVLEIADINSWDNFNNLPAFMTATCEFSRYDDPSRVSAGELILLNTNGGGIALFTTTRLAYASDNFALTQKFYDNLLVPISGEMPSMGDVFRITKALSASYVNTRNFTLLGDPALTLAYPDFDIQTTAINNDTSVNSSPDTLKALSKITVTGYLKDKSGQKLTGFNGVLYPTVYDKASSHSTLANDPQSTVINFKLQKNILYKGKVTVKNGDFSFSFIVPKDIAYQYGTGRISYYAHDNTNDAAGYFENIIIGGSNPEFVADEKGPDIQLFLNDEKFVYGGITDENPVLLAIVSDSNGVNTVGNGIGHDITAILDNDNNQFFVLNDYYEADMDSYQKGKVRYPFSELSEGKHTLTFKVWDVYNNSSETSTEFIVASSAEFALSHVLNYPNPFTTHTSFYFEHNRPCLPLDIQLQIYTVSGRLIKTILSSMHTDGYRSDPIDWNGLDDFGNKIAKGVYVYRVKVRSLDGATADKFEKLVILN